MKRVGTGEARIPRSSQHSGHRRLSCRAPDHRSQLRRRRGARAISASAQLHCDAMLAADRLCARPRPALWLSHLAGDPARIVVVECACVAEFRCRRRAISPGSRHGRDRHRSRGIGRRVADQSLVPRPQDIRNSFWHRAVCADCFCSDRDDKLSRRHCGFDSCRWRKPRLCKMGDLVAGGRRRHSARHSDCRALGDDVASPDVQIRHVGGSRRFHSRQRHRDCCIQPRVRQHARRPAAAAKPARLSCFAAIDVGCFARKSKKRRDGRADLLRNRDLGVVSERRRIFANGLERPAAVAGAFNRRTAVGARLERASSPDAATRRQIWRSNGTS